MSSFLKRHFKKHRPLRCQVEDGVLRIEIGAETLKYCTNEREGLLDGCTVIDAIQFAKDVVHELEKEREDGSTILTDLLDLAQERACDNGSTAIEYAEVKEQHRHDHRK